MRLVEARRLILQSDWTNIHQPIWFPDLAVGWYPVKDEEDTYTDDYFTKFEHYTTTQRGIAINESRLEFVKSHYDGEITDVGVGSGHFMQSHGNALGFDVSAYGVRMLNQLGKFSDPYVHRPRAITCWDSFEHIKDCWLLAECVRDWVFMSIPVVDGPDWVRASKHFKPHEHWWYPTHMGLVECFRQIGFELITSAKFEIEHGREQIHSFAFKRVRWVDTTI